MKKKGLVPMAFAASGFHEFIRYVIIISESIRLLDKWISLDDLTDKISDYLEQRLFYRQDSGVWIAAKSMSDCDVLTPDGRWHRLKNLDAKTVSELIDSYVEEYVQR